MISILKCYNSKLEFVSNYFSSLYLFRKKKHKDSADLNTIESKWANVDAKRTPDFDQMNIEQYQVSNYRSLRSEKKVRSNSNRN